MSSLLALGLSACAPAGDSGELAVPDFSLFYTEATDDTQAYDVLLRDCGFVECHGREGRFLRIFGPGRTRLYELPDDTLDFELAERDLRAAEITAAYNSARAVIDVATPDDSDLLRKPLAPGAGGAGHKGTDEYGRDVYADRDDPNYLILEAFVNSMDAAVQP